jgi:hypothetical protein
MQAVHLAFAMLDKIRALSGKKYILRNRKSTKGLYLDSGFIFTVCDLGPRVRFL